MAFNQILTYSSESNIELFCSSAAQSTSATVVTLSIVTLKWNSTNDQPTILVDTVASNVNKFTFNTDLYSIRNTNLIYMSPSELTIAASTDYYFQDSGSTVNPSFKLVGDTSFCVVNGILEGTGDSYKFFLRCQYHNNSATVNFDGRLTKVVVV